MKVFIGFIIIYFTIPIISILANIAWPFNFLKKHSLTSFFTIVSYLFLSPNFPFIFVTFIIATFKHANVPIVM